MVADIQTILKNVYIWSYNSILLQKTIVEKHISIIKQSEFTNIIILNNHTNLKKIVL
jgi:hypothetical protein